MKINTTKLVVGVLAVAGVASLVGSISGTVAWFQYNTRTVAEFGGTTTKCSEYLEMRTVKSGIAVKGLVTTLPSSDLVLGDKYLKTDESKVYEVVQNDTVLGFGAGVNADQTTIYDDGSKLWKYDTTSSSWVEEGNKYGEWINYLDQKAMKELTGNNGTFSPVTAPAAKSGAALPTLYANPICGYEAYNTWEKAAATDYMQFTLQFRVLDLDGTNATTDNGKSMLDKDLFITDLTIQDNSGTEKEDVTKALRFFITDASSDAKNQLFAKGAGTADTFDVDTYGQLNLGGVDRVANDIGLDVRNNYSFKGDNLYTPLVYGTDGAGNTTNKQTINDLAKTNKYIPEVVNGHITAGTGTAIGKTTKHEFGATVADLKNTEYLTLTFTTWLEGWHEFGTAISGDKVDVNYIGLAPETAADGATWFNTKDNKVYTYSTSTGKWNNGEAALPAKYYTTDGGKTGMQNVGGNWKNVNNRIWSDTDYVGSAFNIGISFGVDAL